jgi:cation transporter-like permease
VQTLSEKLHDIQHGEREHHHWHYVYKRRRNRALGISAKQMAASQVFSLIGSIIAGVLLEANKDSIALMAGAFVILPGVFDLDGSIGAALSAKINHRLSKAGSKIHTVFFSSVFYAIKISAIGGVLVGLIGGGISVWLFDANFYDVFSVAWIAIMLSAVIGFPLIAFLSVVFRELRVNPDDVVGPIESSIFDVLTVVTIALVIGWLV